MVNESQNTEITKVCVYCKVEKPLSEFHIKVGAKHSKDSRCITCKNDRQKRLRKLKKLTYPPTDNICECCGKKVDKLVPDHDDKANVFRGWICHNCNTGIGKLGDNISGLETALKYLNKNNI